MLIVWSGLTQTSKKIQIKLVANIVALFRGKLYYFLLFIQGLHLFILSTAII